jgi:hypothetical protein
MKMIRRTPLFLAATFALAACGGDEQPAGVIPRDKFVAANVAVRSLPDGATPQEKAAALRKLGVTDVQLKAWVNGHIRDPETLAQAWEQIAFKLDSLSTPMAHVPPPPVAQGAHVPPPRPKEMADSVTTILPPPPQPQPSRIGTPQPSKIGAPPGAPPRRQRARVQ